jgi:hypothetical protein
LIERSIKYDLNGEAQLRFLPSGLECAVTLPLAAIVHLE